MSTASGWLVWALLSAAFAALTAIFAKIGLEEGDSDLATLIRTTVILVVLAGFVYATGKWSNPLGLSGRTWAFLVLSGLATGASWVCYFRALKIGDASKVAPVDKGSLVLVALFAFAFLHERPSLREWTGIFVVAGGVLGLAVRRGAAIRILHRHPATRGGRGPFSRAGGARPLGRPRPRAARARA